MVTFVFTKQAEKAFRKLSSSTQQRVKSKLLELKSHNDILSVLKSLHHFKAATHRLRIGDHRLILALEMQLKDDFTFLVVDIGHRREIYR